MSKLRFITDKLARFKNEIEYKLVVRKLMKKDLMADVDDQRSHHFHSLEWVLILLKVLH